MRIGVLNPFSLDHFDILKTLQAFGKINLYRIFSNKDQEDYYQFKIIIRRVIKRAKRIFFVLRAPMRHVKVW